MPRALSLAALLGICCSESARAASRVLAWGGNTYGETNVPSGLTNAVFLTGGNYHALALRSDRTALAWGRNSYSQTNVPPDATGLIAVTAGESHSAALRADGSVDLWGWLPYIGVTNAPPSATNLAVLAVGPAAEHILGLRRDGSLFAYGGLAGESIIPLSVSNAVAVAAGGQFSVAVRGDGSVAVWGDNTGGQTNVPSSATNIVGVSAGANHVLGLRSDGTLLVWGSISSLPPGLNATNVVEVASGADHCLALRRDGTMLALGTGFYGQAVVPKSATNISAIAGTVNSSLALAGGGPPILAAPLVDRTVVSGATAYFRVLAYGAIPMSYQWIFHGTNVPSTTNSIFAVPSVQPNQSGTCSVIVSNSLGTVASPDCYLNVLPLILNTHPRSQAAFEGESINFSVSAAGQGPLSYQWQFNGTNLAGATASSLLLPSAQVTDAGLYSVSVSNPYTVLVSSNALLTVTPILITSQPQGQSVFRGGTATLSVVAQASLPLSYQWSFNGVPLSGASLGSLTITNIQYGQSGLYTATLSIATATTNSADALLSVVPVAAWGYNGARQLNVPAGLSDVVAIAGGELDSLALRRDGTLAAWGSLLPTAVPPSVSNVVAFAAGAQHTVILNAAGTVFAWGANSLGQTNIPSGLTNAIALSAGDDHTLALRADGTVIAWGRNREGQTNVPSGLSNVVAVAAGEFSALALKADGTVVAWGDNLIGQTNVPPGLTNVVAIAGGPFHSVALLDSGRVVSWGHSNWGQNSLTLTDAVAVAAGYECTVALRANGTVVAVGYPYQGQTNIPPGLTNAVAIAAGQMHNLALVGDGPPVQFCQPTAPAITSNGFTVSVKTECGRVYRLEYKESLSDVTWKALPLAAGNGRTLTLTDPLLQQGQRFYRIHRW
jgi:alpha-tubulin suppressor-like RCC1 family protein